MDSGSALHFLNCLAKKIRLQILTVSRENAAGLRIDFGLRDFLSLSNRHDELLHRRLLCSLPNTIYRMTDEFLCSYVYLRLPDAQSPTILIAGPYITFEVSHSELLEEAERRGVPPWLHKHMEEYYYNLPVIQDAAMLLNVFISFGETIWNGSENFQIVDVDCDSSLPFSPITPLSEENSYQSQLLDMQIMEKRYNVENELMQVIARGQLHRAEQTVHILAPVSMKARSSDPIRNTKNYCIIANTLMRKAAEQGGVHPVYLDATSSDFAIRIEQISSLDAGQKLFGEMLQSYCRLVRNLNRQHFSPPVERAIALIEANISQNLSLSSLAEALCISDGYLSTIFRKETGKTLTEFVSQMRMEHAAHLLQSSSLQVQTVAQYCGIMDVNYFSKLFKRFHGVPPREYRKNHKKS